MKLVSTLVAILASMMVVLHYWYSKAVFQEHGEFEFKSLFGMPKGGGRTSMHLPRLFPCTIPCHVTC